MSALYEHIPIQVVLVMKTLIKRLGPQSREVGMGKGIIEKAQRMHGVRRMLAPLSL